MSLLNKYPFLVFVRKEFFHISRDSRTVLILLGIPIVQIILFGFAITTEVKNGRVAVMDLSNDIATLQLKERLASSEYFTVTNNVGSTNEINQLFQEGKIDLAIVFENRFDQEWKRSESPSCQIITDTTDPNSGQMMAMYAQMVMFNPTENSMIMSQMMYNPGMKGAYNFVPGVMALILLLICAMMTSISIVREKERGTMEILLVSPIKPINIIIAKMVPYFFLSIINLTTVLLLSVFVLDVPIAGNLLQLILFSLLYIVVGLALGLLISTLAATQVSAMLISGMVLMMPVIWFSGMMFPIENMPIPLQYLSTLLPARWYLAGIKKIMIQGLDITYAWRELIVLAAMATGLIVVSIKKFSNKLS